MASTAMAATPREIIPMNSFQEAPAKKNSASRITISAAVVPRSGSMTMSPPITTATGSTGTSSSFSEPRFARRDASTCAPQTTRANLAISLGWKPIGPT